MKKTFYILLAVVIAASACFYANSMHYIGGRSSNGSPYKFYYDRLDDVEKQAYDCIIDNIYNMPERIRIPYIDGDQLNNIFEALLYDNPDLFFIGRKCTVVSGFMSEYFSVEYIMDKNEYLRKKSELEKAVSGILKSVADDDDWQTELNIHDYIVDHCTYENHEDYIYSSSYGALINGKAACEGYSKAAKLLLDKAGIENGIVCGKSENQKGQTAAHMWNAVCINGNFYHLDCTWDDPVNDNGTNMKMYAYFNLSDEMISASHSDFSYKYHCISDEENYYIKTGCYFKKFGQDESKTLTGLIEKAVDGNKKYVQIRFADKKAYSSAVKKLIRSGEIYDILSKVKNSTEKNISTGVVRYYENEKQLILTFVIS